MVKMTMVSYGLAFVAFVIALWEGWTTRDASVSDHDHESLVAHIWFAGLIGIPAMIVGYFSLMQVAVPLRNNIYFYVGLMALACMVAAIVTAVATRGLAVRVPFILAAILFSLEACGSLVIT